MDPRWLSNAYLVADRPEGRPCSSTRARRSSRCSRPSSGWRCTRRTCSRRTRTPTTSPITSCSRTATGCGSSPARDEGVDGAEHLGHGEVVEAGDLRIEALRTPGHTRGMLAFVVDGEAVFTGDTLFTGSVGGTQDAFDDLRRSVMDVLMGLPHELASFPGHTEETTIGREWEREPVRPRLARRRAGGRRSACHVAGEEATLVVWAPDYDGGGKAWVRFADGRDAIVGGSRVERARLMVFIVLRRDRAVRRGAHDPAVGAAAPPRRGDAATLRAPQMLTGLVEGRLLEFLVFALQPQRVLELGTYSGYSSLSMAAGAPAGRAHRHLRGRRDARRGRAPLPATEAGSRTASRSTSGRRSRPSSGSRASWTSSSSTPTRPNYRRVLRGARPPALADAG